MYEGKKLLIVDDSPMERKLLKDMLGDLGFTIIEAETGEDGVKKAMEYEPSLILMDVMMPGINGFQATKQITTTDKLKGTPVIMCTSKNENRDKIWSVRQGASGYVVKPVQKEILRNEIDKVMPA